MRATSLLFVEMNNRLCRLDQFGLLLVLNAELKSLNSILTYVLMVVVVGATGWNSFSISLMRHQEKRVVSKHMGTAAWSTDSKC